MINQLNKFSLHYIFIQLVKAQNEAIRNGKINQRIADEFGITGETKTMVMKGGRFAGKTVATSDENIEGMLINKQTSKIVVMPLKKDHATKTIRAIANSIESLNKQIKGSENFFRRVMDKTNLRYELNWPNGHKQEIRFLSLDEVNTAGDEPLPNTYFDLTWYEELVSAAERSKLDFDEKEILLSGADVLYNTLVRHIPDDAPDLLNIYTFNPYNKGEPLLEDHNHYLPDNKKRLEDYGFDWVYIPEKKKLLITSNYIQNLYLNQKSVEKIEKDKIVNYNEYLTTGLGMSASPRKYQFAHIRKIIDQEEHYKTDLSNVDIISGGIDVGESEARTSVGLFLFDYEKRAYTTYDILTVKPDKKLTNNNNHQKNIIKMIKRMEWLREEYFYDYERITFNCDGAAGEFIYQFNLIKSEYERQNKVSLEWLNLIPFREDVKKHGTWRVEKRQKVWEQKLTSKELFISPLNDKALYNEIVNLPIDEDGKRSNKGDDAINRAEMSMGSKFIPYPKKNIRVIR